MIALLTTLWIIILLDNIIFPLIRFTFIFNHYKPNKSYIIGKLGISSTILIIIPLKWVIILIKPNF